MLTPPRIAPRVLLSKIGLDGHDRGIRIVARGLREAGFHVIYAGMWLSPEAVVQAALDEDVSWLGISLLSGAHMTLVPRVQELMRQRGMHDVGILIGGIIPDEDVPRLLELGVKGIFGPGTPISKIVEFLHQNTKSTDMTDLAQRFRQHDRRALSRLLTLAAQGVLPDSLREEVLETSSDRPCAGRTVALTGGGGVGKSSLIARLVDRFRRQDQTVAVLCCDPESSLTGGALLGDRVRIATPAEDQGRYIRSLSTRAGQQAIAAHLNVLMDLLRLYGFQTVVLETVGAGQGDIAVRELADRLVVLLQPETGDELQWEKAGILEVADVVVIHKSDLPGAEATYSQVHELLNLPGCRAVPVLKVSAAKDTGLEPLCEALKLEAGGVKHAK